MVHMDEFIDELLREERVLDVQLPRLQKRNVLEENDQLEPRQSVLDDDIENESSDESDHEDEKKNKKNETKMEKTDKKWKDLDKPEGSSSPRRGRSRSRSKSRSRSRDRSSRKRR